MQAHYLRHNKAERSPTRIVCLDTESTDTPSTRGRLHRFRCGVATFDLRTPERDLTTPKDEITVAGDVDELWDRITSWTRKDHRTWLFAHNLGFDLTVSQAFRALPARGWELKQLSTTSRAPIVRWTKKRASICMVDSASWWPAPLAKLGAMIGTEKLPMPRGNAGVDRWLIYCQRDVHILRALVLSALEWWDDIGGGNWGMTGAQTGWAHFRHNHRTHDILVHSDRAATTIERAAYHGGRRELFFVGERGIGTYPYLDFTAHYPSVARDHAVPVRYIVGAPDIPVDRYLRRRDDMGLIAHVEVTTERALVPVRVDNTTVYPVGTFRTTLCGPELDLLLDAGAELRIIYGCYYELAPALSDWARWVIAQSRPETSDLPAHLRLMVKGWSRSVIGKFGQTGRVTHRIGDTLPDDFAVESISDRGKDRRGTLVRAAGQVMESWVGGEPDNAVPSIAAWVCSQARVDLQQLIDTVGAARVLWCDTDGLIYDARRRGTSRREILATFDGRVHLKAVHKRVSFRLPGEIELDDVSVVKGLPSGAVRRGPRAWDAELWPGLNHQLGAHAGVAYETWSRPWTARAAYRRGYVLDDGTVEPLELKIAGERNVVVPIDERTVAARSSSKRLSATS